MKEANVIKYYVLCNRLKNLIRTGWTDWNVKKERLESVAEHIFGVQSLAIAMKSEYDYDLDFNKVLFMLAIHELEEIYIGDLTYIDISKEEKLKIGHEAIKKVLSSLKDKDYLENLIKEFDERKTKEAIFAYQCDKLECDLQCKLYDEELNVDIYSRPPEKNEFKKLIKENSTWSKLWLNNDIRLFTDNNFLDVLYYARDNKISIEKD